MGGDVIAIVLAQLSGSRWPTPVVFSFGWVGYAFKQIALVFGSNRLLLLSDVSALVINGRTGHVRPNRSWILGRLLRDYESRYWMKSEVADELDSTLKTEGKAKVGLCISLFTATTNRGNQNFTTELEQGGEPAIEPRWDALWILGYFVAFLQLCIAANQWGLWGQWQDFLMTDCGTVLSFLAGSVSQWRQERWSCRRLSHDATYILMRRDSPQNALVIFAKPGSLNLEDLAASTEAVEVSAWTKLTMSIQLIPWVALLITADGLEIRTWFLVLIGGLGMLYTILAAVAPRTPENWEFSWNWSGIILV